MAHCRSHHLPHTPSDADRAFVLRAPCVCIVRDVPASGRICAPIGFFHGDRAWLLTLLLHNPQRSSNSPRRSIPRLRCWQGCNSMSLLPLRVRPLTAAQVANVLGVNPEKLSRLLYALVTAKLLTVEADSFANTPEAQQFLVKGQLTYLGGRHESLSENWGGTAPYSREVSFSFLRSSRNVILTFRANFRGKMRIELSSWDEQKNHRNPRTSRRHPSHHRAPQENARG